MGKIDPLPAELHAPPLHFGERILRPLADHAGLELCHTGHLLKQEFADRSFKVRKVDKANLHAGAEQLIEKRDRSREPVDLRDNERRPMRAAERHGLGELGRRALPAALDLDKLCNQFPVAAVEIARAERRNATKVSGVL